MEGGEGGEVTVKSFKSRWNEVFGRKEVEKGRECLAVPYEYVEVAGDAVLAARIGRGTETLTAIDVYGVTETEDSFAGLEQEVMFKDWSELRPIFKRQQFRYWKKWIRKNGYTELPIRFHPTKSYGKSSDDYPYESRQSGLNIMVGGQSEYMIDYDWTKTKEEPLVLLPRQSIIDALECIETGKKWGLPVDVDVLQQAEQDVKSGVLCLTDRPVRRSSESMYQRVLNTNLDDETAGLVVGRLAGDKEKYPKLYALCEKIVGEGGVENYAAAHFGRVYLSKEEDSYYYSYGPVPRGFVRLYYPDVSRSTAGEAAQRKALEGVFEGVHLPAFKYVGAERVRDGQPEPMPVSERVQALIDKPALDQAMARRKPGGSGICGEYEAVYVTRQGDTEEVIRQRMNPLLEVLGVNPGRFWETGSPKMTRKLARVLDTRSPVFLNFDYSHENGGRARVVISQNPTDILQASTDKAWKSCVNLDDGVNRHSLYLDIEAGNAIAYVFDGDKPAGRMLLRFTQNHEGREGLVMERFYGDARFEEVLNLTVKQVAGGEGLEIGQKGFTRVRSPRMYSDLGYKGRSGTIYYGYTMDEVFESEARFGWKHRLTSGLRRMLGRREAAELQISG